LRSEKLVEIIFIDYLTLIASEEKTRADQIKEISSSLKELAKELRIPIVVLIQVKRNEKGPMHTLMDIRGSEFIVGEADTIIFLHNQRDGKTEFLLAKQGVGLLFNQYKLIDFPTAYK
jgi:replicative DNA helicase